jgi:hypothetical protein
MAILYEKIVMPTTIKANFSVRVLLGDEVYRLAFHYNERLSRWFLSLFDQDDEAIFEGYALLLGIDYLRLVRDERLPEGSLVLDDSTGANAECGVDDLGQRCNLFYITDDGEE